MQQINDAPRQNLTADQVMWLVQDSPAITTAHGLELINQDLTVIEDISGDCAGGSVSRNSYATLHATASLAITRDLDWGAAIVRPYMTMSDGLITARFNLGAYYTSVPERQSGDSPATYAVAGFDILHRLADRTGTAYAVPAGSDYLTAVEAILLERGYTRYVLDPTAAGKTLPSAYTSPLDDDRTWLGIVNDLLAAVGYAGVWSDWDGRLRCEPYILPRDRPVEWLYDADPDTSMMSPDRTTTLDLYEAPNRWVFIRNNDVDGSTPVEGAGIFTYVNESTGDTSLEARDGRVISRIERVDAADQVSLEARAWVTIDADMRTPTTVKAKTSPNPLHWHFDRIAVDDPDGSIRTRYADALTTEWTLPLDGGDMDQSWTVF